MNIFETLSTTTQKALDNLRKEIIKDPDIAKIIINCGGDFLAIGYLIGQGAPALEAIEAIKFARSKNFWFHQILDYVVVDDTLI